jgi:dTDP-glucose pyrophosphorylase/predicted transcriptional regulator
MHRALSHLPRISAQPADEALDPHAARLHRACVTPEATVRDALAAIDRASLAIALVVRDGRVLLGTVTDGDVRRAILQGASLDASVTTVMNAAPVVGRQHEGAAQLMERMLARRLRQLPIVDAFGAVVALRTLDELVRPPPRDNLAVIMAGGLGERLRPLTENVPKPMLLVGDQPILARVIRGLARHGFSDIALSVNFRADVIEGYFQDGSAFGARIRYVHERERMGTAGALSLLPERPTEPFFVLNADLLTDVDYAALMDFHVAEGAALTMCVATHDTRIAYGVVRLDGSRVAGIVEKPRLTHHINAGIYVLDPRCLDLVPRGAPFDMPALIDALLARGERVAGFAMRETWLDIGQLHDYQRAVIRAMSVPPANHDGDES